MSPTLDPRLFENMARRITPLRFTSLRDAELLSDELLVLMAIEVDRLREARLDAR